MIKYTNKVKLLDQLALGLTLALTFYCNTAFSQFGPPPAEVPSETVMPRPTDAQVEQAQELLANFKEGLNNESRALFETYPYMLQVTPPGRNTALIPDLSPNFRAKHEANLEVANAGNIDLLFLGDSITDFWRNETGAFAGKAVFDEYFGHWNTANFGIAGDTTQGVLYRLQNGEAEGYTPKVVMLLIGVNNTRTHNALEIAEGVGAVVVELHKNFPDTKVLLLSVFPYQPPNSPIRNEVDRINSVISKLDNQENIFYMDIGDVFLDASGNIPTEVMSDGLHPSSVGYKLWADAVIEPLTELMND